MSMMSRNPSKPPKGSREGPGSLQVDDQQARTVPRRRPRFAVADYDSPQAANFYHHHGFVPSPIDDLTLMLLTKDIQT
jgi:hypothetical protein